MTDDLLMCDLCGAMVWDRVLHGTVCKCIPHQFTRQWGSCQSCPHHESAGCHKPLDEQ